MRTNRDNSPVELIQQLAVRLDTDVSRLSKLIAETLGKPIRFAQAEVHRTAELLNAGVQRYLKQDDSRYASNTRVRYRPHGSVAVITPANNPVFIPLAKIHAALLYGNSVIWKPAPEADRVSREVHELLLEVGFSDTQIQLLPGGNQVSETLMRNSLVSAVALTGSESTGRIARQICSERNIPLQAELGGNNAAIVASDADFKLAARAVARGAFEMAGQRCTANRRVIVAEQDRETMLAELQAATQELSWGDPMSLKTDVGPLVSQSRCQRVEAFMNRVKSESFRTLTPLGEQPPQCERFANCWFPPTMICCDDGLHEIVQEETFAPILVVQSARDPRHALELCNGVRQGLVASIFSRSDSTIEQFLERADAGMLKINQSTADAQVDVPFCAWKNSGSGPPEHGEFNRLFYSRPQTVYGEVESLGIRT